MIRRRLLIGLIALSAVVACGGNSGSGGSPSGSSSSPSSSSQTVEFKETEYTLGPATLTLKPGTYTFHLQNVGQFPHDLHVAAAADGTEVGASTVITAGQSGSFTITLKSGSYTMWCAVDAHRSLGMQGTLTVS
jgi:plastocyanin